VIISRSVLCVAPVFRFRNLKRSWRSSRPVHHASSCSQSSLRTPCVLEQISKWWARGPIPKISLSDTWQYQLASDSVLCSLAAERYKATLCSITATITVLDRGLDRCSHMKCDSPSRSHSAYLAEIRCLWSERAWDLERSGVGSGVGASQLQQPWPFRCVCSAGHGRTRATARLSAQRSE